MTSIFQIKESPEGDWNSQVSPGEWVHNSFQIKESPEGDWNLYTTKEKLDLESFQIKESPEGDWNMLLSLSQPLKPLHAFKLKNPRKGTETKTISK